MREKNEVKNFQVNSRTMNRLGSMRLLCIVILFLFSFSFFFTFCSLGTKKIFFFGINECGGCLLHVNFSTLPPFFVGVWAQITICDRWIITELTYINLCKRMPTSSRRIYFNATSNSLVDFNEVGSFIQQNFKEI